MIGIVITLLVLLINASLQSRSQTPVQELAAGAWIDRILPIITASNEQGREVQTIWSNGSQVSGATLLSQLNQIGSAATSNYEAAAHLRPPSDVAGASGLLEAALYMRSKAIGLLKTTLQPILTGQVTAAGSTLPPPSTTSTSTTATTSSTLAGSTAPTNTTPTSTTVPSGGGVSSTSSAVLSAIATVGDDLKIGDLAYQSFVESLPKLGVTVPASAWASDLAPYQPGAAQVFLTSLANAQTAAPVHEIKIYSISTSPPAVSTQGSTLILPDQSTLDVTVVIADVGNQPENNLTVTASISPASGASSVRVFENLTPGQSYSVVGMGPLSPPQGVPVTLTVTVTPGANSPAQPVTGTLVFEMPSQATTTTTTPGSSGSTTPPTT